MLARIKIKFRRLQQRHNYKKITKCVVLLYLGNIKQVFCLFLANDFLCICIQIRSTYLYKKTIQNQIFDYFLVYFMLG